MYSKLLALLPISTVFLIHYTTSQIYSFVCVPFTLEGFLQSIITTASPICTGLLTIMTHTSNSYSLAIASGVTWFIASLQMKQLN